MVAIMFVSVSVVATITREGWVGLFDLLIIVPMIFAIWYPEKARHFGVARRYSYEPAPKEYAIVFGWAGLVIYTLTQLVLLLE